MSVLTIVILLFSLIGAADFLFGNKIGVGKEFQRAFTIFCPMALSMLGMLVIAPAIGVWLTPFFKWFYEIFRVDPSIIPASLFANDMGGTALSQSIYITKNIGDYNAFIVSSMMGCVVSFTIPFALGITDKENHKELFFGILCGIATIPTGSFVAGLICKLPVTALLINLLPLIILSVIIGTCLILIPDICIKCFKVFGMFMRFLGIAGLVCAVFTFLTKIEINPHFDTFENAALICSNACVTLSGTLPLMFIISKMLNKPLNKLGSKIGVNNISALAFLGTMVTNATTFGVINEMDKKGIVLNSAFAVSASFAFGAHLAFTMAFDKTFVTPMIIGKIISGIFAVVLAFLIYKEDNKSKAQTNI